MSSRNLEPHFVVSLGMHGCHSPIVWTSTPPFLRGRKVNYLPQRRGSFNFMASFYGWGSTASRLEPLRGGSLLFTTKFPAISGTHFTDLGRMKGWVDLGATQFFWTRDPWIRNPASWPLGHCSKKGVEVWCKAHLLKRRGKGLALFLFNMFRVYQLEVLEITLQSHHQLQDAANIIRHQQPMSGASCSW